MTSPTNLDDIVRLVGDLQYGHLEHRDCTAEAPMRHEDKDRFRWHHIDAVVDGPFFNLVRCTCPHCGFSFTCLPRLQ